MARRLTAVDYIIAYSEHLGVITPLTRPIKGGGNPLAIYEYRSRERGEGGTCDPRIQSGEEGEGHLPQSRRRKLRCCCVSRR